MLLKRCTACVWVCVWEIWGVKKCIVQLLCLCAFVLCELTFWTNIMNTLWMHFLKTHYERTIWKLNKHSEHIMNKHSKDTFLLCANNNNNNIYMWRIQYLSHSSRTEMHPINTHYEFLIHIANCPSAAYGVLFSLSHLHIFHLRYCKQLCKLCELFVILNSCCLFCILYTHDVL